MNKTIAIQFLACIFLFSTQSIYSQSGDLAIDFNGEVEKMVSLPSSPEATAFEKHGNTNVSLYTGTPSINIPLHEVKGREMSLPISLSYDASGVKVEQQATWVGLGWNLNVGGRISRVANGLPDDYIFSSSRYETLFNTSDRAQLLEYIDHNIGEGLNGLEFNSISEAADYFAFLKDLNDNKADIQPDYFSINVPGLSDYIVFDYKDTSFNPRALRNPRLKIEYTSNSQYGIESWKITNDDGTIYHFGSTGTNSHTPTNNTNSDDKEIVFQQIDNTFSGTGVQDKRYISSWLLVKIESPNKKDIFDFSYTSSGLWTQPLPAANVGRISHVFDEDSQNDTYGVGSGNYTQVTSLHQIEQEFLTSIQLNSKTVVSTILKGRNDLALSSDSALDEIRFHKYNTSEVNPEFLKRVKLNHSYFGDPNSSVPITEHRLKLDSLNINSDNETTYQTYSFDYEQPENLPSKISWGQDYLGFYNGQNSNPALYPQYISGGDTYVGGNLFPDFTYAKIGLLKKINYPTKGYTEFDYELNTAVTPSSVSQTGGTYTQEVGYAGTSLTGGIITNNPYCHSYCDDKYVGAGDPKYKIVTFQVPDTQTYLLDYQKYGTAYAEAVIVKGAWTYEIANYADIPTGNYVWSTDASNYDGTISLDGNTTYSIMLVNDSDSSSNSIHISREETISIGGGNNNPGNYARAGIRIKSIIDFSADGKAAYEKNYVYAQTTTNSISSGQTIYDPKLIYLSTHEEIEYDGSGQIGTVTKQVLNRMAGGSGSNQPHIGYHTVYEIIKDVNNTQLDLPIYTKHEFNTGVDGITSVGSPPYFNSYFANFGAGKPKSVESVNSDYDTARKTETVYDNFLHFSTKGMTLEIDPNTLYKYVLVYPDGGKYKIELLDPVVQGYQGTFFDAWSGSYLTVPPACFDPDKTCILNDVNASTYRNRFSTAQGSLGAAVSSTSTEYFDTGDVIQQTQMSYDTIAQNHYVLREQTTTNSLGKSLKAKFYYPHDNIVVGSTELVNANRLNEVVKTESLENDIVMSSRETDYSSNLNTGVIMPSIISAQKGDLAQDMEERIHFEFHDNGNIKESKMADGSVTSYVWGYDETQPVARVENVAYTDIEALPEFSNVTVNQELSAGQEAALRSLPNAMVTTYTYKPYVGVTSITDPRGYVTHFEYDEFNRLKQVKDDAGNILSSNEYHYKGQ